MRKQLMYTGAAVASSILLFSAYRKKRKENVWIYDDLELHNNVQMNRKESPNADVDSAEKGLTELDATYRAEWHNMGYPQTHRAMEGKTEGRENG